MIRTKLFLACALAFAVSLVGTSASAQEPTNQITFFTFSAPFELPGGKTLPAGKYVFKIVDSPGNRHVVQVMSEDQKTMHTTLLAIPAQRQDPADDPEVRFMEAAANTAPAIRTWWYPGRSIGHEFIYPKDHARRLASTQTEGVLTVTGDATGDDAMRTADLARIGANGQETAVTAETTPARSSSAAQTTATTTSAVNSITQSTAGESTSPTQTTTATGQPERSATAMPRPQATTRAPDTTRPAAAERTELPRTASALPLVGLIGLASLLAVVVLRRF
jgi:hypothetical protein